MWAGESREMELCVRDCWGSDRGRCLVSLEFFRPELKENLLVKELRLIVKR